MEYYSAIKKSEIRSFTATWMDLESVILSEVSQKRRTSQDTFSLPLWFPNTSAIHLVREHSSNFPEQRILEVEKLILMEHVHVISREVLGMR